jgi:hypothetical protein
VFLPFVTLTGVALGLSADDVGETGVASGEKTDILDSLSTEGALELSRVMELSLSLEDFFDAGGGISVICFSGEPEKGGAMRLCPHGSIESLARGLCLLCLFWCRLR